MSVKGIFTETLTNPWLKLKEMYVAPRRCIATFSSAWGNRSSCVPGYRLRALLHRKYVSVAPQVQRDDANSFRFLQNCKIFYYSSKAESIETDHSSNLIKIEERNDKVLVEAFNETWVPPNRPFVGHTDQPTYSDEVNKQDRIEREKKASSSHFTKLSRKEDDDSSDHEQNSKDVNSRLLGVPFQQLETDKFKVRRPNNAFPLKIDSNLTSKDEKQPDWLKLRRSIFGNEEDLKSSSSVRGDASPCKMYTLLSANEIVACIESLGGKDITLILDRDGRMGGPIGIILVTSNSIVQMNRICELLVHQLRRRKLHECNIVGASLGIEGKVHRDVKATKNRNHWLVVDCGN